VDVDGDHWVMPSQSIRPRMSAIEFDGTNAVEILDAANAATYPPFTFQLSGVVPGSFSLDTWADGVVQYGEPCLTGDWLVVDGYARSAMIVSAAVFSTRFVVD
jgi:hypothetical protein